MTVPTPKPTGSISLKNKRSDPLPDQHPCSTNCRDTSKRFFSCSIAATSSCRKADSIVRAWNKSSAPLRSTRCECTLQHPTTGSTLFSMLCRRQDKPLSGPESIWRLALCILLAGESRRSQWSAPSLLKTHALRRASTGSAPFRVHLMPTKVGAPCWIYWERMPSGVHLLPAKTGTSGKPRPVTGCNFLILFR